MRTDFIFAHLFEYIHVFQDVYFCEFSFVATARRQVFEIHRFSIVSEITLVGSCRTLVVCECCSFFVLARCTTSSIMFFLCLSPLSRTLTGGQCLPLTEQVAAQRVPAA